MKSVQRSGGEDGQRATFVLSLLGEARLIDAQWSDFCSKSHEKPDSVPPASVSVPDVPALRSPPFKSMKSLLSVLATTHPVTGKLTLFYSRTNTRYLNYRLYMVFFCDTYYFSAWIRPRSVSLLRQVLNNASSTLNVGSIALLRDHSKIIWDFFVDIFSLFSVVPPAIRELFEPLLRLADVSGAEDLDFASIPNLSSARSLPSSSTMDINWTWEKHRHAMSSGFMFPSHHDEVRPLPSYDGASRNDSDSTAADTSCRSLPRGSHHERRSLNPGLMNIHCSRCGRLIGFFVLKERETPRQMFEVIFSHFQRSPALIMYDMACRFYKYAVSREPKFFANATCVIDSFHWPGHCHCPACFNISRYGILNGINDQQTEQLNSRLKKTRTPFSYMNPDNFFFMTSIFYFVTESYRAGASSVTVASRI